MHAQVRRLVIATALVAVAAPHPSRATTATPTRTPTAGDSCGNACTVGTYCRAEFSGSILDGFCDDFCRCFVEGPTRTQTPSPTATPRPTAQPCVGDCNGDGIVTIAELVMLVNIALGNGPLDSCPAADCANEFPGVFVNCAVQAVHNALYGCGGDGPLAAAEGKGN